MNRPKSRPEVVFVGTVPPPVDGRTVATELVLRALSDRADVVRIDLTGPTMYGQVVFRASKAIRAIMGAIRVAARRRRDGGATYLVANHASGVWLDILLASVARCRRYPVFLHHHAYSYVDHRSVPMAILTRVVGRAGVHVVLCEEMGEALRRRYPPVTRVITLPNTILMLDREVLDRPLQRAAEEGLSLGHLSNLSEEKGLGDVIATFAALRQRGCRVRLILAGPIARKADRRRVEAAVAEHGAALEYRGPAYGAAKWRLYEDIDVFLLPTRYALEAQPLVLAEALACGVPVIAYGRSCIPALVAEGGVAIRPGEEFVARAVDVIEGWCHDTRRWVAASYAASARARTLRQEATAAFEGFLWRVCHTDSDAESWETALSTITRGPVRLPGSSSDMRRSLTVSVQASRATTARASRRPDGDLRQVVTCPACRTRLAWSDGSAACLACRREYPITEGIPVLLLDVRAADEDELTHHKSGQAAFFDRDGLAEFEITRPRGTPRLHAWLLEEKFRRSLAAVPSVKGATALIACGGSGMDAEFLARQGARVISADISLGAAQRAAERARRHGFSLLSIVADVERLPFADRAVDLVYVHDGLHHLVRPEAGLTEMARVAAHAISITEPACAVATHLAIRLGLALEREEAGNLVARMRRQEVMALARSKGFRVVCADRYMMYYRHRPGWPCRLLSLPGLFGASRSLWRAADGLAGQFGNKLTVQAVREPECP